MHIVENKPISQVSENTKNTDPNFKDEEYDEDDPNEKSAKKQSSGGAPNCSKKQPDAHQFQPIQQRRAYP